MTPERLRELYGDVPEASAKKVIDHIDDHVRQFLAACPYIVLATSNGRSLDVSPKGDPAGFLAVENEKTLILPDRPGNNRLDGMLNILINPKVALLLLIPTVRETMRIKGTAEIHDDVELTQRYARNGRTPKTVLRIHVDKVMTHCGKSALRAGLWKPESWPAARPVANQSEMLRDHTQLDMEILTDTEIEQRYRDAL